MLAAFSLLPLLAARYLGRGGARWPMVVVAVLGTGAVVSLLMFFGDFAPLAAGPLLDWAPGESVGMTLNLAFLATVLLGPAISLLAAVRASGEATRRLADPLPFPYDEGKATEAARIEYAAERLRLLYVGITRAKLELVVTWNNGRDGKIVQATPFIALQTWWETRR